MAVNDESQTRLLEAATTLLCREAIGGVRELFKAEAIARATRTPEHPKGLSRHTVYRLWPDRRQATVDVAVHVADLHFGLAEDGYAAATKRFVQVLEETSVEELDSETMRAKFSEVLSATFDSQFTLVRIPTGWVLHAAALTSSPLWKGPRPDYVVEGLGRDILAARAALYVDATERWVALFQGVLAIFRRRPRSTVTVETIIRLMHCMFEGCVLRLYVEPELNDPNISEERRRELFEQAVSVASDAMVELAWAYTEPGSLRDPRRPADDGNRKILESFDRLVAAATSLYAGNGEPVIEPAAAALKAGVSKDVAAMLFPDAGDLVDSTLRGLLAAVGLEFSQSGIHDPTLMIQSVLRRLNITARSHPRAIAAAKVRRPIQPADSVPLLDELADAIAGALAAPEFICADPARTAQSLVQLALDGDSGWTAVETILNLLGAPSEPSVDTRTRAAPPEPPAIN